MKYYKKDKTVIALSDEEAKPEGYKTITEEEFNRVQEVYKELAQAHFVLKKTDFKALKFAEGWIGAEEYAPVKELRQSLRDRINELKESI